MLTTDRCYHGVQLEFKADPLTSSNFLSSLTASTSLISSLSLGFLPDSFKLNAL